MLLYLKWVIAYFMPCKEEKLCYHPSAKDKQQLIKFVQIYYPIFRKRNFIILNLNIII